MGLFVLMCYPFLRATYFTPFMLHGIPPGFLNYFLLALLFMN